MFFWLTLEDFPQATRLFSQIPRDLSARNTVSTQRQRELACVACALYSITKAPVIPHRMEQVNTNIHEHYLLFALLPKIKNNALTMKTMNMCLPIHFPY